MLKPFQILGELIEFALQALFLYVLAIILCVGMIAYVIVDNEEKLARTPKNSPLSFGEKKIEEKVKGMPVERECTRPSGCRILEDGTIEW